MPKELQNNHSNKNTPCLTIKAASLLLYYRLETAFREAQMAFYSTLQNTYRQLPSIAAIKKAPNSYHV